MDLTATVSMAAFSRIVGVTPGRISQLVQAGVLATEGTLAEWLLAYCEQLRTQAAGRASSGPLDLSQERAALALEQRRIAELKRGQLEDRLVDKELVARTWAGLATQTRDDLLLLPDRLAPLLEMRPGATVRQTLDTEIRASLHRLADGA
jgi:phage terminase Nu1 subunit (DNA packaging protein)